MLEEERGRLYSSSRSGTSPDPVEQGVPFHIPLGAREQSCCHAGEQGPAREPRVTVGSDAHQGCDEGTAACGSRKGLCIQPRGLSGGRTDLLPGHS